MGNFYYITHRSGEAENAWKEALPIWRDLAAQNPATYQPLLTQTLSNLDRLNREGHELSKGQTEKVGN